ncbi:MAG: hypothetical protein ACE149_18410 [Armatimonadota bacterium]
MVAGVTTVIGSYLAQSIWRKSRAGVDGYGQPTFGTAVQTKGRWLEKRRLVRNANGEQVISEVSVTLAPDEAVAVGDQLSLDGVAYLTVIVVSADRDLAGGLILKRAYL